MAVFLSVSLISCEKFPADPGNTLERVRDQKLRVGITENPPYVIFTGNKPSGAEVEMLKAFGRELNAEIEWVKGSEEVLMTLLREGQLNICAGGFSSGSVWKKHVYFTTPHDTISYRWGTPPGRALPQDIKEKQVYLQENSTAGAFVHKKGGHPVYRDSLKGNEPLIVAPERELATLNYRISEEKIKEEKIALAVQKGENAFVERLEKFMTVYAK